jgi:hypothetical protein
MSYVIHDIVFCMRYKYIIRYRIFLTTSNVRTPGQERRWQRSSPPTQRVLTWAEPLLRFAYYFYAAQSAGRHETHACPFVDAHNGHGHMEKRWPACNLNCAEPLSRRPRAQEYSFPCSLMTSTSTRSASKGGICMCASVNPLQSSGSVTSLTLYEQN